MASELFDERIDTLQVGFSPWEPRLTLMGEDLVPFGASRWGLQEIGHADGRLTPGEALRLAPVDFALSYDVDAAAEVTFLGVVDIDGNGRVDGVAIEEGFAKSVLTDLAAFLDYRPFSTEVAVSRRDHVIFELPDLPPVEEPPEPLPTPSRSRPSMTGRSQSPCRPRPTRRPTRSPTISPRRSRRSSCAAPVGTTASGAAPATIASWAEGATTVSRARRARTSSRAVVVVIASPARGATTASRAGAGTTS